MKHRKLRIAWTLVWCLGLLMLDGDATKADYWLFILLVAFSAAAPWIPWPEQFSLRLVFIWTALVAVVLWLIVWAAK